MSKHIDLPATAVLVVMVEALESGPRVSLNVDQEWWAGAAKDRRKAVFVGAVEAMGRAGLRIIPEEYGPDAMRELPDLPDTPEPEVGSL